MKAKLDEAEIDLIEAALIFLGAHASQRTNWTNLDEHNEQSQRISTILKKMQTLQSLSTQRSIMMEPMK